jgi:arginyl-tRNA synthetase
LLSSCCPLAVLLLSSLASILLFSHIYTRMHTSVGVICGPDGKRFKSRSGETVRLVDLLDASVPLLTLITRATLL